MALFVSLMGITTIIWLNNILSEKELYIVRKLCSSSQLLQLLENVLQYLPVASAIIVGGITATTFTLSQGLPALLVLRVKRFSLVSCFLPELWSYYF